MAYTGCSSCGVVDWQGKGDNAWVRDRQHLCTVKYVPGFYGKITGNQLPVHFPLFFTGAHKHFQESGAER